MLPHVSRRALVASAGDAVTSARRGSVSVPMDLTTPSLEQHLRQSKPGALESGMFCCIRIYSTSPDMHSGLTI